MKQKRVLLVYLAYSTFVREDDHILSAHFEVEKYQYRASKKPFRFAFEMGKQFVYCLFNTYRFDTIYIWFSDYHSFIPALFGRLFGKQVVVVVGGYDAVSIPVISFGVFLKNNFRAYCARRTFQLANLILPVDESLIESMNTYADPSGLGYPCGIRNFVKNINARIEVVPTGYDDNKWKRMRGIERKKAVITIGGSPDLQTFKRKGLDLFIETASLLPEIPFYLVGLKGEMEMMAKKMATKNVHFMGYIPNHELPAILNSSKVFVQFSLSEGLPNTLCEAMLCECIPVGSNVNGIPKGIGNHGFILNEKNAEKAATLIRTALDADDEIGKNARNRVVQLFTQDKRREKIHAIINQQ